MLQTLLDTAVDNPVTEAVKETGYAGFVVAVIGIALCVIMCGIGSAIGLYKSSVKSCFWCSFPQRRDFTALL